MNGVRFYLEYPNSAEKRKALEEDRNRKIVELYLRAQYTQEIIGETFGVDKATISRLLQNAQMGEMQQDFTPPQPPELLEYCLEALDACKAGDSERVITFPGGVTVTAGQLIDDLRLNDLLEA